MRFCLSISLFPYKSVNKNKKIDWKLRRSISCFDKDSVAIPLKTSFIYKIFMIVRRIVTVAKLNG